MMSKAMKQKPSAALMSALVFGSLALGACAPRLATVAPYTTQHPIQIAETVERLELYVRPEGINLSARDRAAMARFVGQYGMDGDGAMFLNVPSSIAGAPGMRAAQAEIQNLLMQSGLAGAPIQTGQYGSRPGVAAPLVLSFRRLATVPHNCMLNDNMIRTSNNQAWGNFGCSAQSNFAVMVDDPRQFLDPYPRGEASSQRREIGFEKYVEGKDPSSEMPGRQQVSAGEK